MADHKVTVEELPNGKWACFYTCPDMTSRSISARHFKTEESAESWLDVSESVTAIEK
jgi:hypothetical protein